MMTEVPKDLRKLNLSHLSVSIIGNKTGKKQRVNMIEVYA